MSDFGGLADDALAAIRATLVEVREGTPLWGFSATIIVHKTQLDVGWPFASWALVSWLKGGFVQFVSHDSWTSRSLSAPEWAQHASDSHDIYLLAHDDALDLAADIQRWRDDVDGVVEAVPTPSAPLDDDEWITWLEANSVQPPPVGPDVVSRAEARALASMDTSDLNRWFIFPSDEPSNDG